VRAVPRGAALLSVLTFGAYLVGLLRDRIFARTFGAGAELDAYNAAFVLPELTLDVLVASGLAAPFIPIFVRLGVDDEREAHAFAQTILTGAVLLMTTAAVVLFVFAPQTTDLIAPSFEGAQRQRYVDLFRVMLVTPILFAASLTLGEVLLVERRWISYGIAPLAYNAGIVLGTVVFSGSIGIFGPAIGAVIGALLHLGVRVWGLRRSRFGIRFRLRQRTSGVDEFIRLMLPKMVTHPIEPTTFLFFTAVASGLAAGSITAVSFARNFQSVPVSVIGVAFALAAFPSLSAAYAAGDRRAFMGRLTSSFLSVAVLTTGAAIVLAVVGRLAIELFLGGGAFDARDVALTAAVLAAFALSIPFESLTHLLSRAIYATRNTLLQVLSSLAALAITVAATLALVEPIGIIAIPAGFAIGNAAKVALLAVALLFRLRTLPGVAAMGTYETGR
jgi:putative peptidoglycan lipid II flippase